MYKNLRLYLDTSIFGGYFDKEFIKDTTNLIENLQKGKATILLGQPLIEELINAPQRVKTLLQSFPVSKIEYVAMTKEVHLLRDAYIRARVVEKKSFYDATHVALATISRADAIVSWNFKHIVRLDRIKGYNKVNLENGFREIVIVTPKEVYFDEKN